MTSKDSSATMKVQPVYQLQPAPEGAQKQGIVVVTRLGDRRVLTDDSYTTPRLQEFLNYRLQYGWTQEGYGAQAVVRYVAWLKEGAHPNPYAKNWGVVDNRSGRFVNGSWQFVTRAEAEQQAAALNASTTPTPETPVEPDTPTPPAPRPMPLITGAILQGLVLENYLTHEIVLLDADLEGKDATVTVSLETLLRGQTKVRKTMTKFTDAQLQDELRARDLWEKMS